MKLAAKKNGLSGLAKIEENFDHPIDLFRDWHEDARRYHRRLPDACCLATASKDNKISARNVVLREFDNDGFVIVTDKRSRKIADIEENPEVAMTFAWLYVNKEDEEISRQVRLEGTMRKMQREEYEHLYDREPIFCKIRSHICEQGRSVAWEDLKRRHDEILGEVWNGKNNLPMPDHFIGYKLSPRTMEFYFAKDLLIGDRLLYRRADCGTWQRERIAA